MKTSIATVSISGDLREKLEAIAAAGFDGVEIFENDFLAFDSTPAEVRQICADLGLEITLFQPFRDFEGLPEPHRSAAFNRAERKFDLMEQLGAPLVLICSSVAPAALGGIDRAAADFRDLGERAAQRGLKVGYEALAWGRHVFDHRDAWEIVRRADHPNVGLILDSFHTLSRGINPDTIRSIPGDKIFIVQMADAPAMSMDLLYWSRHYRNMPGEGDLPVVDFTRAVLATGYDGPFSLEIFNDQFRSGSPRTIAADGKRSLLFLADQAHQLEPTSTKTAPTMPPRAQVSDVSFVEFAADETEAEQLAALLRKLGFRHSGRHRSKAVNRYSQGAINIIINTEREGLAHASYITHGTSAYAMGLIVDDAQSALARAKALDAQLFNQSVAPNELVIPAIRGIGGGVIYFLDNASDLARVWDIEFEAVNGAAPDAHLKRIDHLAQTMNYEEMLTWILFYTSIFRTRRAPMVDVVDPSGLVRSQAIEGDALRLTLNGAENRKTLAGHFIAESFGSSVQHLAFESQDIFATSAALDRLGFERLTISPNYYDDLEARFGLDPAFADRLRAGNILYDRDSDGGEYFQLYSPVFGEGFFLEIVERRSSYRGYGAPNAPFRIAAQKRHIRPAGMPRT
jgi:4-hydroxyphenylpyruvate dioxygenase